MSAVIPFPTHPRALSERERAVRDAVHIRARSTKATLLQRQQAISAAVASLARGDSAGVAIQRGYDELPSVRQEAFRQPTSPRTPDAA